MNELTYTRCGDYYIPDLKLSEQPEAPIGKYGRMRQRYLKEHRPGLYSSLILSEMLYPHLLEIDRFPSRLLLSFLFLSILKPHGQLHFPKAAVSSALECNIHIIVPVFLPDR